MVFCLSLCQVTRPDGKPETLGLVVLDEPIAKQSDPTGTVRKQRLFMRQRYIHNNTINKSVGYKANSNPTDLHYLDSLEALTLVNFR